jgi:peptidoglycan/LPS O-acetylase OafA/YrhL
MTSYRPEIDGLRALAVVPVILFHAGFEAFSGGFVGVDVFFVISGYLITSIILAQKAAGTFSLLNFYERRARRILPALFLVMTVCVPFAWLWLLPRDMQDFAESVGAVSLFLSNHLFLSESGYFETAAELKPLLHTWSLAVEEQYYILFPLFLLIMWRFAKRWTVTTLALITILSFALAQWAAYNKPEAAFFLLPTRGWEIAIGALVAFYFVRYPKLQTQRSVQEAGGLIGLLLILYAVFTYSKTTPFPSVYALAPTLGAALIIICTTPRTIVGRLLTTKAVIGMGLISYSAYLWHQPLFVFARYLNNSEPKPIFFLILICASIVLAFATWRYIELPFRDRTRFSRDQIFSYAIIGSICFIAFGLSGRFLNHTFENYWLSRVDADQRQFYSQLIKRDNSQVKWSAVGEKQTPSRCRLNVSTFDEKIANTILDCARTYSAGVLILGDSHAIDLYGVVSSRFENEFLIGITRGGCRPHSPSVECQYDAVMAFIKRNPTVFKHIVYEQAGFYLLLDRDGHKGTRSMFSALGHDEPVSWLAIDEEHISATTTYLAELSKTVPITWFLPRLEPHISKNYIIRNGCRHDYRLRNGLKEKFLRLDEVIVKHVQKIQTARIKLVSQIGLFRFEFPGDFLSCEELYWRDGDHFSVAGQYRFGKRLPENFLSF